MQIGVWTDIYDKFKESFQEGKIYIIDNFNVRFYKEHAFKCVNYDRQIWLSGHSTVTPVEHDDGVILKQAFDFIAFEDLERFYNNDANKNQLIGIYSICNYSNFFNF